MWKSPIISGMNSYINQHGPLEYTTVLLKAIFPQFWRLKVPETKLNRAQFC